MNFNSRPSARGDRGVKRTGKAKSIFQFTPLREGRRTLQAAICPAASYFNSRPSARGDDWRDCRRDGIHRFQFTPLREGRHSSRLFFTSSSAFQFTPLREGRRERSDYIITVPKFQFTPLREGRRDENAFSPPDFISIHAPPRGATAISCGSEKIVLFQFTPLREGRQERRERLPNRKNFNSRPSARGDGNRVTALTSYFISIHAPPRGATRRSAFAESANVFQFTPLREGRRLGLSALACLPYISIHAPPRGATQPRNRQARCSAHFNSRPSARGDRFARQRGQALHISIHAPPRGATTRELK